MISYLNKKVLTPGVMREANRVGYGRGLLMAGRDNDQVVALSADLTDSTKTDAFAREFPERFVQVGIAEQNMASVAAGMAALGKIPFIASYAMFSPGRSWEQVRTTIAYNDSNVKIVGAHAGISVGPDGATHQAIEDIALMRVIPNMTVLVPCDVHEAKKAVLAAAEHKGPVYIRIAREATPIITTEESPFAIGKAEICLERDEAHKKTVGIISCGTILYNALMAAKDLNKKHKIGASVLNLATIKPLDTNTLKQFVLNHDVIVTVEEHQISGGLGSTVAEYVTSIMPKLILRIGIDDQFGQSGTMDELYKHYHLDTKSIIQKIKDTLG